ncbi:MAG: PAS domain-containing protein [Clostridiales bacterium]|nr:PAS domain-containing protein [Clostridiales bacterium]
MSYEDREDFFLQILVDYIILNEIVAAPFTEQCLHKVGIKYGMRVEDRYRKEYQLDEKLTMEQLVDLSSEFFNKLGGEYTFQILDEKLILNCYSCPFGHMALKTPALCLIHTSLIGGIAARNFPYSKGHIEKSIATKSSTCQIVYYLTETGEAVCADGVVFKNEPTSYLLTRNEIQTFNEECLIDNSVYNKYVESLESLQSIHRELECEYNQLRNEIFTDLKLGVLTVNESCKITYMNKTAQDLLNVQNYWDTLVTESFQRILSETLHTGTGVNQQVLNMPFPEGSRYYSFNVAPLSDANGYVSGAVSVFQDITEQKVLETELLQMEKFSLVAELAAGTAHEIRNPMTTLRGFLQILSKEFRTETKGYEYCTLMIDEIDRANAIIKEFLLLTKPAAPKLREADLHVILEEIFLLIESKSLLENVEVRKKYTKSLPLVHVDPAQIKQVFLNLATNAIQAMPNDGQLEISTSTHSGKAYVEFKDTGCGMANEQLLRIFDPFFTTKESGTGLGLTISYRIIETHGGRLSAKSIVGKGTTFTIELPAVEDKQVASG